MVIVSGLGQLLVGMLVSHSKNRFTGLGHMQEDVLHKCCQHHSIRVQESDVLVVFFLEDFPGGEGGEIRFILYFFSFFLGVYVYLC